MAAVALGYLVLVLTLVCIALLAPPLAFSALGQARLRSPPTHSERQLGLQGPGASATVESNVGFAARTAFALLTALAARRGWGRTGTVTRLRFGPEDSSAKDIRELQKLAGEDKFHLDDVRDMVKRRWGGLLKVWEKLKSRGVEEVTMDSLVESPPDPQLRERMERGLSELNAREEALKERLTKLRANFEAARASASANASGSQNTEDSIERIETELRALEELQESEELSGVQDTTQMEIHALEVLAGEDTPDEKFEDVEAFKTLEEISSATEDNTTAEIRVLEALTKGDEVGLRKLTARRELGAMRQRQVAVLESIDLAQKGLQEDLSSFGKSWSGANFEEPDHDSEVLALKDLEDELWAMEELQAVGDLSLAQEDTTAKEIRALQILAGEQSHKQGSGFGFAGLREAGLRFRDNVLAQLSAMRERREALLLQIETAQGQLEEPNAAAASEPAAAVEAAAEPTLTQEPAAEAQEPAAEAQQPAAEAEEPSAEAEEPSAEAEEPAAEAEEPAAEAEEPAAAAEEPAAEAEEPEAVAADEPIAVDEPIALEEPAAVLEPAAVEEEEAAKEEEAVEEPAPTEDPAVEEPIAASEAPIAAEEPVAVEEPAAVEEPISVQELEVEATAPVAAPQELPPRPAKEAAKEDANLLRMLLMERDTAQSRARKEAELLEEEEPQAQKTAEPETLEYLKAYAKKLQVSADKATAELDKPVPPEVVAEPEVRTAESQTTEDLEATDGERNVMEEELHRYAALVERQGFALDEVLDVAESLQADLVEVRANQDKLQEELESAQEMCDRFLSQPRPQSLPPSSYKPLSSR